MKTVQITVRKKFLRTCRQLANEYHEKLIESVAELDEDLMEKYFGGEEISIDEIKKVIRKATIDNTMVPVNLRFFIP